MSPRTEGRYIRVAFNELPRSVRARLVECFEPGHPSLLAHELEARRLWLLGPALVLVLATVVGVANFLLEEARLAAPGSDLESYGLLALAGFVAASVGLGWVLQLRWPGRPYREGLYLLQSCGVRTSGDGLVIVPYYNMSPPVVRTRLNGGYVSSHTVELDGNPLLGITFPPPADPPQQLVARLVQAQEEMQRALLDQDEATLARLDPFRPCQVSQRWSWQEPGAPEVVRPSAFVRLGRWVLALALGLGLAGAVWLEAVAIHASRAL